MNPVHGAVGLMASGNWYLCQSAVETVLKGGKLLHLSTDPGQGQGLSSPDGSEASEVAFQPNSTALKKRKCAREHAAVSADLNLSLRVSCLAPGSPSEESGTTAITACTGQIRRQADVKLLDLF